MTTTTRSNNPAKGTILRRLVLTVTAAIVGAVPAAAMAKPTPPAPSLPTAHISLDSYHDWSRAYTPPVSTPFKIPSGAYYVATVDGSFSYYAAINYGVPQRPWKIVCGTPGSSAKYRGAGGGGRVGFDAEFVFARPWTKNKCLKAHLPVRWGNFQMNAGEGWHHPMLLGSVPTAPRPGHTYSYAIVGQDRRANFRLRDVYVRDNYGLLNITVRPATGSDCSSYTAFGFATQSACATAVAAQH